MPDPEIPTAGLSEYEALLGGSIPVMPVDEPGQNPEVQAEPEPEPESHQEVVPKAQLDAVIQERQAAKQRADELEAYTRQLYMANLQAMQSAQRNLPGGQVAELPKELQEVGNFLMPWLQEQMKPFAQTIAQQQQIINMLQGNQKVAEAFDYVRSNVPEFDTLLPDLERWLDSKPEHIRQQITANPDLIINEALIVRELKTRGVGQKAPTPNDARQRARVEGPGPSGTNPTQPKDWSQSNVSDADFAKAMRQAGFY